MVVVSMWSPDCWDVERMPLPFSDADWSECLTLVLRIEEQGTSQRTAVINYIQGIAEFHLGKIWCFVRYF